MWRIKFISETCKKNCINIFDTIHFSHGSIIRFHQNWDCCNQVCHPQQTSIKDFPSLTRSKIKLTSYKICLEKLFSLNYSFEIFLNKGLFSHALMEEILVITSFSTECVFESLLVTFKKISKPAGVVVKIGSNQHFQV